MESITLTAIAAFLAPYLEKGGEKVAEKMVEGLLASRKDLAERFKGLFHTEIITLGLNETSSNDEIARRLHAKPEVKEEIRKKIEDNRGLIDQLTEALSKQEGRTITCNTYIEKIEHIDTAHFN